MGQAGGKEGAVPVTYDPKQISEKYNLTDGQVQTLVKAFEKEAPKGKVDKAHFVKIISAVRQSNPELAIFDDEIVGLVFQFCDTDHSGKLDPYEVLAAISTFAKGDDQAKAKLVFKTIDKDNSGVLTKDEIRAHAKKISAFSGSLVKADIKSTVKGALGSIAASGIGTAVNAMESQFVEDLFRDVMTNDTNKDGYISLDEWCAAVKTSNTVKALVDPNLAANAWRVIFGIDAVTSGTSEVTLQLLMASPKGLATIFDWELEQGKVKALGVQAPPPDLKITIAGTIGGVAKTANFVVTPKTTYAELLEIACTATDAPKDSLVLRGPKGLAGDRRFPETTVYDNVGEGDKLEVVVTKNWDGKVIIKTLTGKSFNISCSDKTKVAELKQKIQDSEGIPPDQQRTIYQGRQMDDEKTLGDYEVIEGSSINLVLRLRGN